MEITSFTGQQRFLSNFYLTNISYRNQCWPSAEHLYQGVKTLIPYHRDCIRLLSTSAEAKKYGARQFVIDPTTNLKVPFLRTDWDDIKLKAMGRIVYLKFLQNVYLRQLLIETHNCILVENNYWHDNYWGNCLCKKCLHILGENHLGKILMNTRDYFLNNLLEI